MACINCGNPSCRGCHVEHNHVHINHSNADKCGSHSHGHGCTPCAPCGTETPECESLSSQITNFTKQFFGAVIKTELNGVISWTLPCNLDVGLENNPRFDDEGLACYFLRLFQEGIIGLTGPEGETGPAGTNGRNAYTVTLASFLQPSLANPNVQVLTSYNPAILEGMDVIIATSGRYVVTTNDTSGLLFLTFVGEIPGSPAAGTPITAGKLVVPSGAPGQSIVGPQGAQGGPGPQGPQGIQGPQGDPGVTTTTNNEFYFDAAGTNYTLTAAFADVDFTSSMPTQVLTEDGSYLITVVADVIGLGGVATSDQAALRLFNNTTVLAVPGSEHRISGLTSGERRQIVINVITQTFSPNEEIALQGECTNAGVVSVLALRTTVSYVQIS